MKSDERRAQEQRELSTLMVIYTTPSDIPSSPREPSEPFAGETSMEESFGAPIEQTKVYLVWMQRIPTVLTSNIDA